MSNISKTLWILGAGVAAAALSTAPALAKVEGDTIVLGAAVSLTGKYSTNGKNTIDGYNLAVETINKKGGIKVGGKTYKLEVRYYDDESTPARGAQLAERLIKQDGVKFMLGPYSSGLTKAIAPVTEKYKVPMVEGNGAARDLFNKGYKYMFAVLSTSEQYLTEAVNLAGEMAEKNGKKRSDVRIAIAVENDPFSQDVRTGIIEDAKKFGMKIVIDDKLPREINDMSATMTKVKALKPDVLVVSGHAKGATLAVRQVADQKVYVPMLALTHCESAKVHQQFPEAAENTLCATQWAETMTYKDDLFGSAGDYAKTFKARFDYTPPYQAAESTASVQVWADAFKRAQSFDTEKLRDAIAKTDMQTFYGNVKFDATGKNIAKPMVLRQIQKGKYNVVAPTKWASHKLVWPRPKVMN